MGKRIAASNRRQGQLDNLGSCVELVFDRRTASVKSADLPYPISQCLPAQFPSYQAPYYYA
jgi:hypothetical protein